MRLVDGSHECTLCGAILDVPAEIMALVEAAELDGGQSDAIVVEGIVIHQCESPASR